MSTHGMERLMSSRGHDDMGPEAGGTPGIVASIAPTTAATCRGPGCRRKITKGELRLQVGLPESDYIISDSSYGESASGFYCFQPKCGGAACLFKTFRGKNPTGYKYGADQIALAKPTSTADIGGFDELSAENKALLTSAVEGTFSFVAESSEEQTLTLTPNGPSVECSGDTYTAKEALKKLGCKWNRDKKAWVATGKAVDQLLDACDADVDTDDFFDSGEAITVTLTALLNHHAGGATPAAAEPSAAAAAPTSPAASPAAAAAAAEPASPAAAEAASPAAASPAPELSTDEIDGMKVAELKAELKKRTLRTGGNKSALAKRLKAAIAD